MRSLNQVSPIVPYLLASSMLLCGGSVLAGPAAPSELARTSSPQAPDKAFKVEFGAGVGVSHTPGPMGLSPEFSLRAGARYRLSAGTLAVALEGGYQQYGFEGTGSLPCPQNPSQACIESNGGNYDWSSSIRLGRLSVPLSYRLSQIHSRWIPQVTVAPGVYLARSQVTSFDLQNTQFSTGFGLAALLGVGYRLGPGALVAQVGYQWTSLSHRVTGPRPLHTVVGALGYRIQL